MLSTEPKKNIKNKSGEWLGHQQRSVTKLCVTFFDAEINENTYYNFTAEYKTDSSQKKTSSEATKPFKKINATLVTVWLQLDRRELFAHHHARGTKNNFLIADNPTQTALTKTHILLQINNKINPLPINLTHHY